MREGQEEVAEAEPLIVPPSGSPQPDRDSVVCDDEYYAAELRTSRKESLETQSHQDHQRKCARWGPKTMLAVAVAEAAVALLIAAYLLPPLIKRLQASRLFATTTHHIPSSPCTLVEWERHQQLISKKQLAVYAFHQGEPLPQNHLLDVGAELCLIIAVPQTPRAEYRQTPVTGQGPDSIHMYVNSTTVHITGSPPRVVEGQQSQQQYTEETLLYHREISLLHAGSYEVHADVEFQNWEWAHQWQDDNVKHTVLWPSGVEENFTSDGAMYVLRFSKLPRDEPLVVPLEHTYPPILHVAHGDLPERPICSDEITASRGRWLAASSFDLPGGLVDEWGYAWDGDECRMHHFTDTEIMDCLEDRSIHVFGDSNSRRLSKALVSGDHFCHNLTDACQKDESWEAIHKLVDVDGVLVDTIDTKHAQWKLPEDEMLDISFGRNSTIYFSFQRMITKHWMDWTRKFFAREFWSEAALALSAPSADNLPTFNPHTDLLEGATARAPPDAAPADLVVLAFGTWDQDYLSWMNEFEDVLPHFRDAVLGAYPTSKIVLRISHQICCLKEQKMADRYSLARIQHFNDVVRRVFQVNAAGTHAWDGRILVYSPEDFIGMPYEVRDYNDVFLAHLRYSRVRTETQMLLNAVCRKDLDTGRVSWRWS